MTTFYPPELMRSTGTLTVEKAVITPATGIVSSFDLNSDKAAIGDVSEINMFGADSLANSTKYARVSTAIIDNTNLSEDGSVSFETMQAGILTNAGTFALGLTMNGATGGDQGSGTINSTGLFVNGVAVSTTSGDVVGPAGATDNALARYNLATGKLIQDSIIIVDDLGNVSGINDMIVTGNLTVNGTTTSINSTTVSTGDTILQLGNTNNTTDVVDLGFVGLYDTSGALDLYAGFFRDATDNKFHAFVDSQEDLSLAATVNKAAIGYTVATIVANLEGDVTGTVSSLANHTTDALAEGAVNKYASTANVNAAGAVMNTDFTAFTVLSADVAGTPTPLTLAASTFVARLSSGGIVAATPTQVRAELNVANGAEVNLSWTYVERVVTTDYAAGDTALVMPIAAPGDNENNVRLIYEGIQQNFNDFTIVGTAMTVAAIPAGVDKITIGVLA